MEYKCGIFKFNFAIILVIVVASLSDLYGQTISAPSLINGTGGSLSVACPTNIFNTFDAQAEISGGGFPAGTMFRLQLSNKGGNFSKETTIFIGDQVAATGNRILFNDFSFPIIDGTETILGSDKYRLQIVIASDPERDNPDSQEIAIHYYDVSTDLIISPQGTICEIPPGGLRLTAVNDLETYLWYKDGVEITGQNDKNLIVTETGKYYFSPDLGECNRFRSEAKSTTVTVLNAAAISVNISASGATSICDDENVTLSSDNLNPNIRHQWIKDGVPIAGATTTSYVVTGVDAEGDYRVDVFDSGSPLASRCTSSSNTINIDLKNPSIKFTSPLAVILLPGEQEVLTVETTGDNKVVTWFRNGTAIAGASGDNLTVTQPGDYTARLQATSPCPNNNTVTTKNTVKVVDPESVEITIDYQNPNSADYISCNFSQVTLGISQVKVVVNGGTEIDIPQSEFASLTINWLKDGVDTGDTNTSILIDNSSDNGNYSARITAGALSDDSNVLPVILVLESLSIDSTDQGLADGEILKLSVSLADPIDVALYDFKWKVGRASVFEDAPGANTGFEYIARSEGVYTVDVSLKEDASCTTRLRDFLVKQLPSEIPNVITPNGDGDNDNWVLPIQYSKQPNVEVVIYAQSGKEDFKGNNYDEDWPKESSSDLSGTVYYYIINKDNNPVKQGSITIIR